MNKFFLFSLFFFFTGFGIPAAFLFSHADTVLYQIFACLAIFHRSISAFYWTFLKAYEQKCPKKEACTTEESLSDLNFIRNDARGSMIQPHTAKKCQKQNLPQRKRVDPKKLTARHDPKDEDWDLLSSFQPETDQNPYPCRRC